MHITIRVIYKGYSSRLMQRGSFPVNPFEFEINPDKEAARVAFEWWKIINGNMSYIATLESVNYNEEHNITVLVKELERQEWENIENNFNLPY